MIKESVAIGTHVVGVSGDNGLYEYDETLHSWFRLRRVQRVVASSAVLPPPPTDESIQLIREY